MRNFSHKACFLFQFVLAIMWSLHEGHISQLEPILTEVLITQGKYHFWFLKYISYLQIIFGTQRQSFGILAKYFFVVLVNDCLFHRNAYFSSMFIKNPKKSPPQKKKTLIKIRKTRTVSPINCVPCKYRLCCDVKVRYFLSRILHWLGSSLLQSKLMTSWWYHKFHLTTVLVCFYLFLQLSQNDLYETVKHCERQRCVWSFVEDSKFFESRTVWRQPQRLKPKNKIVRPCLSICLKD